MGFAYKALRHKPGTYRLEALPVFFDSESCLRIIETVLDEKGNIRNFPGITEDETWKKKHRIGSHRDVRFEARFVALGDGNTLMQWLYQPDGWYWVDEDGFGFSGDSSIMLYSVIDGSGCFTKPFELFSIDAQRYCHDFDQYL